MPLENPLNLGYFSHDELQSCKFRDLGSNVYISKKATIIGEQNISIGNNVRIDDNCVIVADRGDLKIGNYVHIGSSSHITCAGNIEMRDFSSISQGVKLYSVSDDYSGASLTNSTIPLDFKSEELGKITLGKHVIVGSGSVVLPGVFIGDGAAVGALSLVTLDLKPWGIYHGNPARFIRPRQQKLLGAEKDLRN